MKGRSSRRISVSLDVRYFLGNALCKGKITNISETGMLIKSMNCLPVETQFDVFLLHRNATLRFPVLVRRLTSKMGFCEAMGVEIVKPSAEYRELIREVTPKHINNTFTSPTIHYVL